MGDMRGEFKAQLILGGKTYKSEMSLNWGTSANLEVLAWLDECWSDALTRYRERNQKRQEAEEEARERAELERLKAKYEVPRGGRS